jgi:hypothetical protein
MTGCGAKNSLIFLQPMPCDAVVTGVDPLAKHKVAGSTPVTRSFRFRRVRWVTCAS